MMKARATSAMLVTAIAVDALVTIALFVSAVGVNGALDTSMTGPRRIERENRLKSDSRQGRTLNSGELSGIMDWEYGGWRPLQTPKGFYRRIARNLFRDDEGKGPNELDNAGDLEVASSNKVSSFHFLGLEDFLRSEPGCWDCGFQPLIFLHGRGPRKIRSTSLHAGFENPQTLDTHREVNIDIRDSVKKKLRKKKIGASLRRSKRSLSSTGNAIPTETAVSNYMTGKLIESEPSKEQEYIKSEALDEAKGDRITPSDEEPHYLSAKSIFSLAKGIAEALTIRERQEQTKALRTTTEASSATEVTSGAKLENQKAHFFSPKTIFDSGKDLTEALAKELLGPNKPENASTIGRKKTKSDKEDNFLNSKIAIKEAKDIHQALATERSQGQASNNTEIDPDEPHFLSPKSILSLKEQITKILVTNFPGKDTLAEKVGSQANSQIPSATDGSSSAKVEATIEQPVEIKAMIPHDAHFPSPRLSYGILKGFGELAVKAARWEAKSSSSNEPKSRVRRQIWNPFRRRPSPAKPSIGGPFGFVNQNVPYEAQGSINSFSFAQNLPQSSTFQNNDFQGIQSFVPTPPITNFEKVSGPLDSQYPGTPSIGQHVIPGGAEFSSGNNQFAQEPVVSGPPPTRPVKRPEQVQPVAPSSSIGSGLPPPHVIDSLLTELKTTGRIPPNLSPETALLLADILSGRKQHISDDNNRVPHFNSSPMAPAIDVPHGPFVPEVPPPQTQVKPPTYHRDPMPAPNFHQSAQASPPVTFGALPSPPKRHQGTVRDKVVPSTTSGEVLYHQDRAPVTEHVTPIASASHGHGGVHLNAEGFQRPHSVTRLRTRKRNKPLPTSVTSMASKLSLAEQAAEQAVEKDHSSIFPQEHVHIHHHHKRKRKRPTVAPAAKIPIPAPEIHLSEKTKVLSTQEMVTPSETSVHNHPPHSSVHDGSHFAAQHSKPDAKVHLSDTKSHDHSPSAPSLEAELSSASKNHPITVDPLQNIANDGGGLITDKHGLANVAGSEYYDDLSHKTTTTTTFTPTVVDSHINANEGSAWPVDDPYLSPPSSTEPPAHTVGPADILIQDAKPGIPLLASDLNSLRLKTNHNNQQSDRGNVAGSVGSSSNKVDSMPAPVFRPEAHVPTHNAEDEAKKQATQDEDEISAGAGAIHFQPIQTKEGDSKTTGNAQLYHAYYAPAHHDPPPGYIRMTVDEFNKLFKNAEIQFIGSEQELQKKLGTKPTNKLNFDINNTSTSDLKKKEKKDSGKDEKEKSQDE